MNTIDDIKEMYVDSFYSKQERRDVYRCVVVFNNGDRDIRFHSTFQRALAMMSKYNEKWEKHLAGKYAKQKVQSQ